MGEFKVIETQEELNNIVQGRLNKQKEQFEEKLRGYEELKNNYDSLRTAYENKNKELDETKGVIEGLNTSVNELTSKVNSYELTNLKTTIALKNNIPYDLANRLVGSNEAEIQADAENLSRLITVNQRVSAPLKSVEKEIVKNDEHTAYSSLLENLNLKGD